MRASNPNGNLLFVKQVLKTEYRFIPAVTEDELTANSCTCCAKSVQPGDVFFAIPPDSYGHLDETLFLSNGSYYRKTNSPPKASEISFEESVSIAIVRGCKAIVAEQLLPDVSIPTIVVPNVRESFGVFCHALYGDPAEEMKLIAVTGTSGKTSTTYLIAGVLAEAGFRIGLIGTLGIFDGFQMHPTRETCLPASELAYWLSMMKLNECTHVIIEVTSDAIAQWRLAGIELDAVCITNIKQHHSSRHKTVESYRRAKLSIFRHLKEKGFAICNIDDPVTCSFIPLIDKAVLTVGIKNNAEITGSLVERFRGEQTFLLNAGSNVAPISSRLVGDAQIYNSLIAVALGVGMDIDVQTAIRGVERVDCVPGRLEQLDFGQTFGVYVDCAQTPDSLTASLKTLRELTDGRVFCILGAGTHLNQEKRMLMARAAESNADCVVLAKDEMPKKGTNKAIEDTLCGFERPFGAKVIRNRADAIAWTLSESQDNDIVLIVGQGVSDGVSARRENFSLGKLERPAFCDRAYAKQWLVEQFSHAPFYALG